MARTKQVARKSIGGSAPKRMRVATGQAAHAQVVAEGEGGGPAAAAGGGGGGEAAAAAVGAAAAGGGGRGGAAAGFHAPTYRFKTVHRDDVHLQGGVAATLQDVFDETSAQLIDEAVKGQADGVLSLHAGRRLMTCVLVDDNSAFPFAAAVTGCYFSVDDGRTLVFEVLFMGVRTHALRQGVGSTLVTQLKDFLCNQASVGVGREPFKKAVLCVSVKDDVAAKNFWSAQNMTPVPGGSALQAEMRPFEDWDPVYCVVYSE